MPLKYNFSQFIVSQINGLYYLLVWSTVFCKWDTLIREAWVNALLLGKNFLDSMTAFQHSHLLVLFNDYFKPLLRPENFLL